MALKIGDGYSFESTCPARGPWPAVRFSYRPALYDETEEHLAAMARGGKAKAEATAELLTRHVTSWDVEDATGNPAVPTRELLRLLPHAHVQHMVNAITGYLPEEQAADQKN